ncbi:hypothetical protein [Streptosporangium sp. KLBMP 9127]
MPPLLTMSSFHPEVRWKETGRYFHLSAPDHLRKVGEVAPNGFYPPRRPGGRGPAHDPRHTAVWTVR